jgi:hypothetical protein
VWTLLAELDLRDSRREILEPVLTGPLFLRRLKSTAEVYFWVSSLGGSKSI